ncbi:MAG: hypothetical protein WC294_08940 [Methanoregula sp.]
MRRDAGMLLLVLSLAGLVFLSGCTGQPPAPPATTVTTVSGTQVPTSQVTGTLTFKPTVEVTVPVTGVFVKVSYLGSFHGTYGMAGTMQQVKNSGERVYEITNATGSISATFFKEDGSTTHEIVVEVWKNGRLLTSQKNSTAFGTVSISSVV